MNIKIGRKLSLINSTLEEIGIKKTVNVFKITAVTDVAVNIKNIYNHSTYTISIESFEKSIKTFLTDEILERKNKEKFKTNKHVIVPIEKVVEVNNQITKTTFIKVAPLPIGKLVFRYLKNTPIIQINDPYTDDLYSDLYN